MAILNQTKGFTRNYDINGNIGVSKRGTAVRQMVSFAKEGEKVAKSYRKYKKKFGKNVVSYVYFAIMLKSFGKVMALCCKIPVSQETNNVQGKNNYYLAPNLQWHCAIASFRVPGRGCKWRTFFFPGFIVSTPVFIPVKRIWPMTGS